ncbi:MAG: DUF1684 domain-containing protein [Ignavibacteriales bacterium]|nr:DUF1684 domain-containing protein [Ignavibacteriales bacterium]
MKNFFRFVLCFLLLSCGKTYSPEQEAYISTVTQARIEKDFWMENDPTSPFKKDSTAHFSPLKYYDVDPGFVFKSVLFEHEQKDTVIIFGTKGEERKVVKYGYVLWERGSGTKSIHVYKGTSRTGYEYYSIWFTDKTTGKETYHVGRYIDFELNPDKNFIYTIDFNGAYNPYCAYSAQYSCAIPSKDDHIDAAIEAGEKNFH